MIKVSIGTKIPPPPTPPTLPNAAPKNPANDPNTIRHPNFIGYVGNKPEKYSCVRLELGKYRISNNRVAS
jgi:hypothetical protein